jgi:hypothetical protein
MLADPAGLGSECPFPKGLQQARNRMPVATSTHELHLGKARFDIRDLCK